MTLLFVFQPSTLVHSQTPLTNNRVLELDGNGSYVQLPSNIFTNLTEATVEAWVKWHRPGNWSRFFDFGQSTNGKEIAVTQNGQSDGLRIEIGTQAGEMRTIDLPSMLRTNEWSHYALVLGRTQTLFFFNGVQVGATEAADLARLTPGARAALGRNLWAGQQGYSTADLPDFAGQMDEVRVWNAVRTEAQIRENMFKILTGTEPGLVRLWNFNDGTAKDSSTNANHGKLMGN